MPNWIEGTMKLRGKQEDIKRFFYEGINLYKRNWENNEDVVIDKSEWFKDDSDKDEGDLDIVFTCKDYQEPHVEGTRRMFIMSKQIRMSSEEGICCFNIRQAWSFLGSISHDDGQRLVDLADKYNVDIRLFGINSGSEFCQEVIVHHKKSETEKGFYMESIKNYEDWDWECPFPDMGG